MSNKLNKKREFDISITGDTYAGVHAMPYVTAAVKSPDTVAKGFVRTIDGLTKSAVINNIASAAPIVAGGTGAACDFTAGTALSTTERVLTLTDFKVSEQICRATVFPTWMGQGMDRNGNLPNTFSDFIMSTVAGAAGQQIENGLWLGTLGSVVGQKGFLSDTGTFDTAGFAGAILNGATVVETAELETPAGTLAFMGEVYDSVVANKPALLSKPGFGFYVGEKVYALYLQSLASSLSYQNLGAAGNFQGVTYMGIPLFVCPGMPTKAIVATYKENLVYGTNNNTDWTEVQLIPTYMYDGSDNVRMVMKFALGVQCAVIGDVVIGHDLV